MSKHTPGPWRVGELVNHGHTSYGHPIFFNDAGEQVVDFCYTTADAHLIATAPELLGDLVEAAATLRRYEALHRAKNTDESTAKAEVNAALATRFEVTIAKARGET